MPARQCGGRDGRVHGGVMSGAHAGPRRHSGRPPGRVLCSARRLSAPLRAPVPGVHSEDGYEEGEEDERCVRAVWEGDAATCSRPASQHVARDANAEVHLSDRASWRSAVEDRATR